MNIPDNQFINGLPGIVEAGKRPRSGEASQNFAQAIEDALSKVDDSLKKASKAQMDVAAGGETSLHEAMIAGQKANLNMRFALQIRNKVLEAYQEIMRMQV